MTECTNIIELKNLGKFLYKMKCKCENQRERIVQILEEAGEEAWRSNALFYGII
jgi:hypothetical protein